MESVILNEKSDKLWKLKLKYTKVPGKSVVVSMLHAFAVGGVYMIIDEDESCRL